MLECTKWTEVRKGSLWGFADIYFKEMGFDIFSCAVFNTNGKTWITWPSKEYTDKEGKKNFWPHCKFRDADKDKYYKAEALKAILLKIDELKNNEIPSYSQEEIPF